MEGLRVNIWCVEGDIACPGGEAHRWRDVSRIQQFLIQSWAPTFTHLLVSSLTHSKPSIVHLIWNGRWSSSTRDTGRKTPRLSESLPRRKPEALSLITKSKNKCPLICFKKLSDTIHSQKVPQTKEKVKEKWQLIEENIRRGVRSKPQDEGPLLAFLLPGTHLFWNSPVDTLPSPRFVSKPLYPFDPWSVHQSEE